MRSHYLHLMASAAAGCVQVLTLACGQAVQCVARAHHVKLTTTQYSAAMSVLTVLWLCRNEVFQRFRAEVSREGAQAWQRCKCGKIAGLLQELGAAKDVKARNRQALYDACALFERGAPRKRKRGQEGAEGAEPIANGFAEPPDEAAAAVHAETGEAAAGAADVAQDAQAAASSDPAQAEDGKAKSKGSKSSRKRARRAAADAAAAAAADGNVASGAQAASTSAQPNSAPAPVATHSTRPSPPSPVATGKPVAPPAGAVEARNVPADEVALLAAARREGRTDANNATVVRLAPAGSPRAAEVAAHQPEDPGSTPEAMGADAGLLGALCDARSPDAHASLVGNLLDKASELKGAQSPPASTAHAPGLLQGAQQAEHVANAADSHSKKAKKAKNKKKVKERRANGCTSPDMQLSPRAQSALEGAVAAAGAAGTPEKRRISFNLEANVVHQIGKPLPPAEMRTPPGAKPRGSVLKKVRRCE